jgi:nitrogen fixation protein NifB
MSDQAQTRVGRGHPCFDAEAHDRVGRVHLPVAPRCNIQCNFCERRVCATVTGQHPGWARRLLSVEEAVVLVDSVVAEHPDSDFVVGVAGPGDPLANEETFASLLTIHRRYPEIVKCISTNGLLLAERLPELLAAGVSALTVTVNAASSEVAGQVYSRVRYHGQTYRGKEGAVLLLRKQTEGVKAALAAGLSVKVNTVLVPGANDQHLPALAMGLGRLGVGLMNVMPLIPAGKMRNLRPPTCAELILARDTCEAFVPQFRRCEQCRADTVCLPGAGPSS